MSNEFRITKPGFYRTRDGRKAEVEAILKLGERRYPVEGMIASDQFPSCWTVSGSLVELEKRDQDLVAEWTDEPKEDVHLWAFKDKNSGWFLHLDFLTEKQAEERRAWGSLLEKKLMSFTAIRGDDV